MIPLEFRRVDLRIEFPDAAEASEDKQTLRKNGNVIAIVTALSPLKRVLE